MNSEAAELEPLLLLVQRAFAGTDQGPRLRQGPQSQVAFQRGRSDRLVPSMAFQA